MDSDNLSKETYHAVFAEAERFNHDLALQFGLLSYESSNEDEFLEKSIRLITKLKKLKSEGLNDVFFDTIPDINAFQKTLDKILTNITETKRIPLDKRNIDF